MCTTHGIRLRPYQQSAVAAIREKITQHYRRIMVVAPTGAGKTLVASHIIESALAKSNPVLFIAHRRELIAQCADKLSECGVIMGGNRASRKADALVQVASVQTLLRLRPLPPAKIVIVDEAHRTASKSYRDLLANYPNAVVLGLSATPERLDGKGLGDLFETMVEVATIPDLIEQGYLVRPRCYVGTSIDTRGLRTRGGDYRLDDLADASTAPTLVGDLVTNYQLITPGRKAAVFCVSILHAELAAKRFRDAGISAQVVSGKTPTKERDQLIQDWKEGYIRVMCSCDVFVEGFDFPGLEVVILARATQSITRYLQSVGRGMRPADGKEGCWVLDHAGCIAEHGPPWIHREWSLDGAQSRPKTPAAIETCQACHYAFEAQPEFWLETDDSSLTKADRALAICPACKTAQCKACNDDFVARPRVELMAQGTSSIKRVTCLSCRAEYSEQEPHLIQERGGDSPEVPVHTHELLQELTDESVPQHVVVRNDYKRLLREARERGYRRGWVFWKLKDKHGEDVVRHALPRHTGQWWRQLA